MDDDTTSIPVPVKARTHELNQLQSMVPRAADRLQAIDAEAVAERGEELDRIYTEHIQGVEAEYPEGPEFANYVSMPADDWRAVVSGLARLYDEEGLRVQWLQNKLVDRLRDRMEEMED